MVQGNSQWYKGTVNGTLREQSMVQGNSQWYTEGTVNGTLREQSMVHWSEGHYTMYSNFGVTDLPVFEDKQSRVTLSPWGKIHVVHHCTILALTKRQSCT